MVRGLRRRRFPRMKSTLTLRVAVIAALTAAVAGWMFSQTPAPAAPQGPAAAKGGPFPPDPNPRPNAVEHIKVHGKSLEGNLLGDSPDRDVFVYLPPSRSEEHTSELQS